MHEGWKQQIAEYEDSGLAMVNFALSPQNSTHARLAATNSAIFAFNIIAFSNRKLLQDDTPAKEVVYAMELFRSTLMQGPSIRREPLPQKRPSRN